MLFRPSALGPPAVDDATDFIVLSPVFISATVRAVAALDASIADAVSM